MSLDRWNIFSILIPAKSRETTFSGEMTCDADSAFVELVFVGSKELSLEEGVSLLRLEGFCVLAADFFIEENTGFAERVDDLKVSRSTN